MINATLLDKTFHIIMRRIVDSGRAPHYTELATELGCSIEEGRQVLHELMDIPGFHGWLEKGTDDIASFTPLALVPTQYRISVDGQQKWFAQ